MDKKYHSLEKKFNLHVQIIWIRLMMWQNCRWRYLKKFLKWKPASLPLTMSGKLLPIQSPSSKRTFWKQIQPKSRVFRAILTWAYSNCGIPLTVKLRIHTNKQKITLTRLCLSWRNYWRNMWKSRRRFRSNLIGWDLCKTPLALCPNTRLSTETQRVATSSSIANQPPTLPMKNP